MPQATLSLPTVTPIIPKPKLEPFDDPEWTFEFKYDGFRGVLYIIGEKGYFLSKKSKYLQRFDRLARKLAVTFKVETAIFDGEIVAFDRSNRPIFGDLLRSTVEPVYVPFDFLWLNGTDVRPLPLRQRRKMLARTMPKNSSHVTPALTVEGIGRQFFALMREHDLEGMVAKRLSDPYEPWVRWYKIKNKAYSQLQGRATFVKKRTGT